MTQVLRPISDIETQSLTVVPGGPAYAALDDPVEAADTSNYVYIDAVGTFLFRLGVNTPLTFPTTVTVRIFNLQEPPELSAPCQYRIHNLDLYDPTRGAAGTIALWSGGPIPVDQGGVLEIPLMIPFAPFPIDEAQLVAQVSGWVPGGQVRLGWAAIEVVLDGGEAASGPGFFLALCGVP